MAQTEGAAVIDFDHHTFTGVQIGDFEPRTERNSRMGSSQRFRVIGLTRSSRVSGQGIGIMQSRTEGNDIACRDIQGMTC